jgi:hypothetical protein
MYVLAMIDRLQLNFAGKSNSVSNKEEKVYGFHHTFPGCFRMHFSYFYLLGDQVRISSCTCLEVACGETTQFFIFFCSKLDQERLYFLSKSILTSLVVNALYYHPCSINDMPCKGQYKVRIDKNDENVLSKLRNYIDIYFHRPGTQPWIN